MLVGITEDVVFADEEHEDGVRIQPAQITRRNAEPVAKQPTRSSLAELLAGIIPENLHEEIDFGPLVGVESL